MVTSSGLPRTSGTLSACACHTGAWPTACRIEELVVAEFAEGDAQHARGLVAAALFGDPVLLLRRIFVEIGIAQSAKHQDQAPSVLYRRPDLAITGRIGITGLQSVGAGKLFQHRVAVGLVDAAPGEIALTEVVIILRVMR